MIVARVVAKNRPVDCAIEMLVLLPPLRSYLLVLFLSHAVAASAVDWSVAIMLGRAMLGRACASLAFALLGAYAASGLELYSEHNADTGPPETLGIDRCLPCEALFLRLEEAPDGKLQQSSHIELRGWVQCGTVCFFVSLSGSPCTLFGRRSSIGTRTKG